MKFCFGLTSALRTHVSRLSLLVLLLASTAAYAAPPTLTAIGDQSVREGETLTIVLTATDDDGDAVTFSITDEPGFCTLTDFTGPTGEIQCIPGGTDSGKYSKVKVTATDNSGPPAESASDNFNLTVTENAAPNLSNISNQSVEEGDSLSIPLIASDPDNSVPGTDILSFSISGFPGTCVLNNGDGIGSIDCNPVDGDAGTYATATVTVTDNAPFPLQDADTFTLTITANTPPTLTPISDQTVAEGEVLNILLSATDTDNTTFTTSALPAFCSLTDAIGPNGTISCNPGAGTEGFTDITVTVTDDGLIPKSASDVFRLTVSENSAPVLTLISAQSVAESVALNIPLSATDADVGDVVIFSTAGLPGFCTLTDATGPTGAINCNPGAGDESINLVTVIATDNAALPGSDSTQFLLTVTANAAPVLTPIDDRSMVEGEVLNIPLSATDADVGDVVTFSATGLPVFCTLTDATGPTGAIDCSPLVGNDGVFLITVTATDDGVIPASGSDPFTLTVGANAAPTASNVAITGTLALGETLTGVYTYADAEGDLEGVSTYRWLRDNVAIPGETGTTYTVVEADIEAALVFEVTPVALTGASTGTPVQSPEITVSNAAPSITGQAALETPEETGLAVTLADLTVVDADSTYPADFTIVAQDGVEYTQVPSIDNKLVTITPALDVTGTITVPFRVNDGLSDSPSFDLIITVTEVNDAPVITGVVAPLSTAEDTSLTIVVTDLLIQDPDNVPGDFTLALQDGANYTRLDNAITPDANFNGELTVPATVTDNDLVPATSAVFNLIITVTDVNDLPSVVAPIDDQNAVEDVPFNLDVSGNFTDGDGDTLTYSVSWVPATPPSISFNDAGVFSGTPRAADANLGPVFTATVTAQDPSGDFATDAFDLTISLRDRANLSLNIDVAPETGNPGDDLRWTLTARNPVGPQPGQNVELIGSFVGAGLTVSAEGGANCTVQPTVDNVTDYVCQLGTLPVGGTNATVFTTSTSVVSEVVAFATAAGAQVDPIDPNEADNSGFLAAAVGEAFSVGAVQILGTGTILSVTAGDINGDGRADLVIGTSAGQSVQVFANDLPRESCQCPRDFVTSPISIPDNGANEGVALGDFDRDGFLDIVVANGGGQADVVYRNDGNGNFTVMATLGVTFAQDVAVGDFNNDGNLDIAVAAVGGNPVYLGDGNGGFTLHATLGNANSLDVAVAEFDANARDDLVFANVGSASRVWTKNSGAGFTSIDQLAIGDAVSVAAGLLNGDQRPDLVFGRVPNDVGDIPENPVMINSGDGTFPNAPAHLLGISPTNDVHIGDVNNDGLADFVFVSASGVHQIWTASGLTYTLHREQIIDGGAVSGVLADLGFTDNGDSGGIDFAVGGALGGGLGVYLNDGAGNLGRGDTEAPVITLSGQASVSIESGQTYIDSGATAMDNIDGNISTTIAVANAVNTRSVGTYTVTYSVSDFAGNAAATVTRTVSVTPSAGSGGGGGSVSYWTVAALMTWFFISVLGSAKRRAVRLRPVNRNKGN